VEAFLAAPTSLVEKKGRLEFKGTPIGALYRYYPTEYMEEQGNLAAIERAVSNGNVRAFSGFDCMYLQSKTVMARAWAHRESLSPLARCFVEHHLPETRAASPAARELLVGAREDWVLKRSLGRVGDEVFVGRLLPQPIWVDVVDQVLQCCAQGDRWIAQRFVPQAPVATPWGERLVTLGAYVLDGAFAGYFARLSKESHVSHDALVVPVFVGGEA
jgi:hypothetical protein